MCWEPEAEAQVINACGERQIAKVGNRRNTVLLEAEAEKLDWRSWYVMRQGVFRHTVEYKMTRWCLEQHPKVHEHIRTSRNMNSEHTLTQHIARRNSFSFECSMHLFIAKFQNWGAIFCMSKYK